MEFINQTMYTMNKNERNQNRGEFQGLETLESMVLSQKQLESMGKLVYQEPFNETLLRHIHREKKYWLGKEMKQDKIIETMVKILKGNKDHLFEMGLDVRWTLVEHFKDQSISEHSTTIEWLVNEVAEISREMQDLDDERTSNMMRELDIVAMTTTGACKYRAQLREVGAQIVLVEEAAEVLEAQIVTSLSQHTQQLILIGDHFQLKPKVTSFELAEDYGLGISLFERLVHLGVPNVQLCEQRRMRPEISQIVRLIYPDLRDHRSVLSFEDIR